MQYFIWLIPYFELSGFHFVLKLSCVGLAVCSHVHYRWTILEFNFYFYLSFCFSYLSHNVLFCIELNNINFIKQLYRQGIYSMLNLKYYTSVWQLKTFCKLITIIYIKRLLFIKNIFIGIHYCATPMKLHYQC